MFEFGRLRFVAVGGALGALVRWILVSVSPFEPRLSILAINVAGSALLGFLVGGSKVKRDRGFVTDNQFALLGAGFCGAFTTFSTFALDAAQSIENGVGGAAAVMAVSTSVLAVVGAGIGYRIAVATKTRSGRNARAKPKSRTKAKNRTKPRPKKKQSSTKRRPSR